MINKDRIKGSAEQAKGKVKEWAGKVTGDKKTETEGKAEELKGKCGVQLAGSRTPQGASDFGPLMAFALGSSAPIRYCRACRSAAPPGQRAASSPTDGA